MTFYYGTYLLPDGKWQSTAIFESKEEVEDVLAFHAQGRPYLIAESEKELEELKRNI